jgi:hypothetical protein
MLSSKETRTSLQLRRLSSWRIEERFPTLTPFAGRTQSHICGQTPMGRNRTTSMIWQVTNKTEQMARRMGRAIHSLNHWQRPGLLLRRDYRPQPCAPALAGSRMSLMLATQALILEVTSEAFGTGIAALRNRGRCLHNLFHRHHCDRPHHYARNRGRQLTLQLYHRYYSR